MIKRFNIVLLATSFLLTVVSTPALAVQTHGGAEGLVSHQIGHFLFTIGMAFLFIRIKRNQETKPGWQDFKVFLCLLIAWNVMTFSGHWMDELVSPEKFVRATTGVVSFNVTSLFDFIYYLTRLDHLILVPAFFFLLRALSRWRVAL